MPEIITAYILITADPGKENLVFEKLGKISQIKEAHQIYGVYDIIAQVKTESMEELRHMINYNLRAIKNIDSTLTMICT